MSTLPPPPREIEPEAARLLRDAAARAMFDPRIFQILGLVGAPGWKNIARQSLLKLPSPACAVMVRFFGVRDPVPQRELDVALGGPEVLPALERAGIAVHVGGDTWQCPFVMFPAAGVWSFTDAIDDPASLSPPDDYIIPVSSSTRFVDDLSVRDPCGLVIDLGCGQGFLAVRGTTHARRCIATDINPRALAFTRTNASLNGMETRIETRLGSFFEPLQDVKGQVDLLTCNPPFIILPEAETVATASPTEGDGMLEDLVRTTPAMLSDTGWATIIGIWENADPSDWVSRVRGWLDGSGCDALVLQFRTYRPDEYFAQWSSPQGRAEAAESWRNLCERRWIGAITFGGIILRKRRGLNWLRSMFTLINVRSGSAHEQLRSYFDTQTALQSIASPAALLDQRLRMAPGWRYDPTQPLPRATPLGVARGLALPLQQAAQFEPLLQTFDGSMTARETLTRLHQSGRVTLPPDSPQAIGMINGLVTNACLDIVT